MISIYHLDTSRSERIVWLMEELGLPYQLEVFNRAPNVFAPEELKQVHPLGFAPVIRDGETVLAESGAIVEYIVARHGGGRLAVGPEQPEFANYLYWLHYAEGSLMPQIMREWYLDRMLPDADAAPGMKRIRSATRTHLALVEGHLASHPYFAGDAFTAADIMMAFPFTTMRRFRDLGFAPDSAIQAYLHRIEARPAYRAAMERAGPGKRAA